MTCMRSPKVQYYPTLEEERDARELFEDSSDGVDDGDFGPDADSPLWDERAADSAAMVAVCSGGCWM